MNRVRYAPSPTGLQHIGGLRTALFNYFFARATSGIFILRIEDTDRKRFNETSLQDLYDMLEWMGIEYDEGPDKPGEYGSCIQSERLEIYREKARELLNTGMAYPCFCTETRLAELRKQQQKSSKNTGYDKKCRSLSPEAARVRIDAGEAYVLRLKIPIEGKTEFEDAVLGKIGRKNKDISPDPVILKADAYPTYHLANVVDDQMMRITHVLRAQEWLPSSPLHILIYRAFKWTPPIFCHLPMVMGTDGSKLSKRHGSTTVSEFRQEGYLPDALMNFVSLLGWSYDEKQQIFSKKQLCQLFTLQKINKSPAIFDYRKLNWFNGQYIRSRDEDLLRNELKQILIADKVMDKPPTLAQCKILNGAMPFIRERLKVLKDVTALTAFLYSDPGLGNPQNAIPKRLTREQTVKTLEESLAILSKSPPDSSISPDRETKNAEDWDTQTEIRFRELATQRQWKIGDFFQPLRFAITASNMSPPVIPAIRLLGMQEVEKRIKRLIESLK